MSWHARIGKTMPDPSLGEDEALKRAVQLLILFNNVMLLVAPRFHHSSPKQLLLVATPYPTFGSDPVCCGHRAVYLNPAAVYIHLEDQEHQKRQQTYGPTAQANPREELMSLLKKHLQQQFPSGIRNCFCCHTPLTMSIEKSVFT